MFQSARTLNNKKQYLIIIFSKKFNSRGSNINKIIKEHLDLIHNNETLRNIFFPKNSKLVAIKKEDNWNDLLLRNNPHDIRTDLQDNSKPGYVGCKT